MYNSIFSLMSFCLLLIVSCAPDKVEIPVFDERNAMSLLTRLVAFGPRSAGSEANLRQIDFIAGKVHDYGVEPLRQEFTRMTSEGKIKFVNIEAVIPGRRKEFIIVGSHFDTKKLPDGVQFAGANDGASSTAALLEMVRTIKKSGVTPEYTLKFVFFDGEECFIEYSGSDGLFGSRHYALEMKKQNLVSLCRAVIILDMIGDRDLTVTLPADSDRRLCEILLKAAGRSGYADYFDYYGRKILDDHTPFQEMGIPAIDIIDFRFGPGNSFWHTSEDKIENISVESLKIVGQATLNMLFCGNFKKKM